MIEKALAETESEFDKANEANSSDAALAFAFAAIIGSLKGKLENLAIEIEFGRQRGDEMAFDPKFYTKRGRLTRYALACGYVERASTTPAQDNYRSVVLEMSGSVLHVHTYQRATDERKAFSTHNMKEARKVFARQCKELGMRLQESIRESVV